MADIGWQGQIVDIYCIYLLMTLKLLLQSDCLLKMEATNSTGIIFFALIFSLE